MKHQRQVFRKKKTFNTSYYSKQIIDENTKHYQIKRWIGEILKTYYFNVTYEYVDPEGLLLAPKQQMSEKNEKPHPYKLDILAYNQFRGEIITLEVNGPYHYKGYQKNKDRLREAIIKNWVKLFFIKRILWFTKQIVHKHITISRDDVYRGFLDYDGLIQLMRL